MIKVDFPKRIMIEATNCCNNKCFFCGSNVSKRKRGVMEASLMYRLIDEAYENGVREISFHGMGEPFLCEELPDYVHYAKRKGYSYIYLDTNGVLATPERMSIVLDAGLDSLKFSIHATTRKTYELITGNDEYEAVFQNFVFTSKYIRNHDLKCKLISFFAENKLNTHEMEAFRTVYEPYSDEVWIHPIHNGSGVMKSNQKFAVTDNIITMKKLPCTELYDRIIIDWEGKAIACCTDWTGNLVYGDTKTDSMVDLWNNDRISELRQEHTSYSTLNEICKACMLND